MSKEIKVYLIGNTEHAVYKIGIAADTEKRRKALLLACPLPLAVLAEHTVGTRAEARQVELFLHAVFAGRLIQGEWFSSITVVEFLEQALACVVVPESNLTHCIAKERANRVGTMVKAGGMCQSCFKPAERGHTFKGKFSDLWVCTDCREWLNSLKQTNYSC